MLVGVFSIFILIHPDLFHIAPPQCQIVRVFTPTIHNVAVVRAHTHKHATATLWGYRLSRSLMTGFPFQELALIIYLYR